MKVASAEDMKKRYSQGAAIAGARYRDAVEKTSGVVAASIAAEDLYREKVTQAANEGRRAKALAKTSDESWRKAAIDKGSNRIAGGMAAAVDKQANNFAPYASVLSSLDLPKKTSDPVANVQNRVLPVVQALVNKKKEILG